MKKEIKEYNKYQSLNDQKNCEHLANVIDNELHGAESQIWYAHPVQFLDKNPIVGYSKQKVGIRLLFWSGADFDEKHLNVRGEKFKDTSIFFNDFNEIKIEDLISWHKKSREI